MPTSSQAMILRHFDSSPCICVPSRQGSSRQMRPAVVSSVDINELFNESCEEQGMRYLEAFIHSSESEVRKKLSKILKVKGFNTTLSYNPVTNNFQWKFFKETSDPSRPQTGFVTLQSKEQFTDISGPRSKSAATDLHTKNVSFLDYTKSSPNVPLPDKILSLGFRDPHKPKELNASPSSAATQKIRENTGNIGESVTSSGPVKEKQKNDHTGCKIRYDEKPENESEEWDNSKYEERCYPAVHQLKVLPPEKNPLVMCFSLPENEKYTHKEIKDLLEAAFNCDIKKLQFDPLSVRAGDPIVRNRWIVEVGSRAEADQMARAGFKLQDVQIVIKSFDEVLCREHKAYLYLEKIRENRRNSDLNLRKPKRSHDQLKRRLSIK